MKYLKMLALAVCTAAAMLFAGTLNAAEEETPSYVAEKFTVAMKICDFKTVIALTTGTMTEQAKRIEKMFQSMSDEQKKAIKAEYNKVTIKIIGEEIKDGIATVTAEAKRQESEKTEKGKMLLKKVDGKWKVYEIQ